MENEEKYLGLDECVESGQHLKSVDPDGYCNFCGHQFRDGPGDGLYELKSGPKTHKELVIDAIIDNHAFANATVVSMNDYGFVLALSDGGELVVGVQYTPPNKVG